MQWLINGSFRGIVVHDQSLPVNRLIISGK